MSPEQAGARRLQTAHQDHDTGSRRADLTDSTDRSHQAQRTENPDSRVERDRVLEAEHKAAGGVKIGAAFFGWLTATGMALLLTALAAAAGAAVAFATNTDVNVLSDAGDTQSIGLVGGIVLLVILLASYYCGGYVAGRMARFNGAKQGLAVWVWAVAIAVILGIVGLVAGSKDTILAQLNSFPTVPVKEGDLGTAGILALAAVALASLVGAVLGGLAGMRFHRKVDLAGLGPARS